MTIVNWSNRTTGGANGIFDSFSATLANPIKISGGYSFVFRESDGFTGTLRIFGSFQIGTNQQPVGGSVTGFTFVTQNGTSIYNGFTISTASFLSEIAIGSNDPFWPMLMNGADRLTGSRFGDQLWAYAGNDIILGGEGNDWLFGGKGNDRLDGGNGIDGVSYFSATAAVNVSLGVRNLGQNTVSDGTDTFISIEKLEGSQFGDTLAGSAGADTLWGLEGNDILLGGGGNDWLYGGKGNDLLNGGTGIDGLSYRRADAGVNLSLSRQNLGQNTVSDGTDTLVSIEMLSGSQFGDTLAGSAGADTLWGLDGNDSLLGADGHDWLFGGEGNDRLYGGAGIDGVSFSESDGAVRASLQLQGQSQNTLAEGVDILLGIEKLEGSSFGDTLAGSTASDTLIGQEGNDSLLGADGHDWLYGGEGNDRLYGGAGIDGVSFSLSDGAVRVSLQLQGQSQNTLAEGTDIFLGIEKLEGSNFGDTLAGSAGADTLWGLDGNDSVLGADGNDWLFGGEGNDWLYGGAGIDGVSFSQSDGAVRVSLQLQGQSQNTLAEGADILLGIEKLEGSNFGDTLTGATGRNYLGGLAGNDTMSGGDGNDVLFGGEGNDRLDGGNGIDWISYYYADGAVVASLNLQGLIQNTGSEGLDYLTGFEILEGSMFHDTLTGSAFKNELWGQDGHDILNGLAGNDILSGGSGNDSLSGGTGRDEFLFFAGSSGFDRIFDFTGNFNDWIGFESSIFLSAASVLAATQDTASGARISWSGGSVLLVGVDKNELSQSDFFII